MVKMDQKVLFNKRQLCDVLMERESDALGRARCVTLEQLNGSDIDNLVNYYSEDAQLVPIEIQENNMTCSSRDVTEMVEQSDHGTRHQYPHYLIVLRVSIPYKGSSLLWRCLPDQYRMEPVYGWIVSNGDHSVSGTLNFEVFIEPQEGSDNKGVLEKRVQERVGLIKTFLETINQKVTTFNFSLVEQVSKVIMEQSKRLRYHNEIVESLSIPLSRNPGAPSLLPVPMKKAESPAKKAKLGNTKETQYHIPHDEFLHILNIVRHEGRTHEQTSKTKSKLNEEEIRNLFLAHLNSHYLGLATAEAFRKNGKTDIRIEFESRSAFIAECKIWHGESKLHEALSQLTSYTTWRDCKCALIIYNKTVKGFTKLISDMPLLLDQYVNTIGKTSIEEPGEWKMIINTSDDLHRRIEVRVFLFNLYNIGQG